MGKQPHYPDLTAMLNNALRVNGGEWRSLPSGYGYRNPGVEIGAWRFEITVSGVVVTFVPYQWRVTLPVIPKRRAFFGMLFEMGKEHEPQIDTVRADTCPF